VLEQQQKTVWPSQQSNRQQKQANKQKQSSAAQRRRSRGPPVLSNDALPVLARADWPAASPVQARIIPQWEWRRRDCLHLHLTRHTSEPCLWRFSRSLPNESLLVRSRSLPNQVVVLPCLAMPCHALPPTPTPTPKQRQAGAICNYSMYVGMLYAKCLRRSTSLLQASSASGCVGQAHSDQQPWPQ
jgi:hypothetical protein